MGKDTRTSRKQYVHNYAHSNFAVNTDLYMSCQSALEVLDVLLERSFYEIVIAYMHDQSDDVAGRLACSGSGEITVEAWGVTVHGIW